MKLFESPRRKLKKGTKVRFFLSQQCPLKFNGTVSLDPGFKKIWVRAEKKGGRFMKADTFCTYRSMVQVV